MFRLGLCGDSWMSPDTGRFPNTHFSQLLCKEQNWHLEWYARPGSSNGAICLQLEQALRDKCDLILFGTTTYNRIEYALGTVMDTTSKHIWEGREEITIQNIAPPSEKYNHQENDYKIVSDNIIGLLDNPNNFMHYEKNYGKVNNQDDIEIKYDIFKGWFSNFYHPGMKQKIDRWCLHAVLQKIRESNISIECVIDFIGMPDTHWLDRPILGTEYLTDYKVPDNGPSYHTEPENQISILNLVKERLKNKGLAID